MPISNIHIHVGTNKVHATPQDFKNAVDYIRQLHNLPKTSEPRFKEVTGLVKRRLRRKLFTEIYTGKKTGDAVIWEREDGSLHPNLPAVLTMLNTTPHALSNLLENVSVHLHDSSSIECFGDFLSRHPEVVKPYNRPVGFSNEDNLARRKLHRELDLKKLVAEGEHKSKLKELLKGLGNKRAEILKKAGITDEYLAKILNS